MRITQQQKQAIIGNFMQIFAGINASVWLFGSRADDTQKGGDIDLLIQCYDLSLGELRQLQSKYSVKLQQEIGPRKIDIVLDYDKSDNRPIIVEAKSTGILLWENSATRPTSTLSDLDRLNASWQLVKFHEQCIDDALLSIQQKKLAELDDTRLINLSAVDRGLFDTLMYRFLLIQDTIDAKIFPLIADLRLGDKKAMIWLDVLYQLEKLHILTSGEDWQELREMRNEITHEYDQDTNMRKETIIKLFAQINLLKEQINLIDKCITELNASR